MICLLGGREDTDLLWLADGLRRRGERVELVSPEEVMVGSSLAYRIGWSGVSSRIRLLDGRVIQGDCLDLVVNRLTTIPPNWGVRSEFDAAYISEEWRAVLVAWLRTLRCPVLNPPRAVSIAGPLISESMWHAIAISHGLASLPQSSYGEFDAATCTIDAVCLGERYLDGTGPVPPRSVRESLAAMSRHVGAPLLGATFHCDGGRWLFVEATVTPNLIAAGEPLVDAVIGCLQKTRPVRG